MIPSKEMIILNKLEEGGKNEKCRNLNPGDSVDHFFLIHRATQV